MKITVTVEILGRTAATILEVDDRVVETTGAREHILKAANEVADFLESEELSADG